MTQRTYQLTVLSKNDGAVFALFEGNRMAGAGKIQSYDSSDVAQAIFNDMRHEDDKIAKDPAEVPATPFDVGPGSVLHKDPLDSEPF